MSIVGYQSTPKTIVGSGGTVVNSQREFSVPANHLNPDMLHSPGRNIYAVINGNIVIGKDLRIRSRSKRKEIAGWQISLPAPINKNQQGEHTGTLLSRQGKAFYYAIDDDGRVFVSGKFSDPEDEIIFNVNPYVAELPLKFRPFNEPVFQLPPDDLPRDKPRPIPDTIPSPRKRSARRTKANDTKNEL